MEKEVEGTTQFKMNLPVGVKRWLEERAKANFRTQVAEILSILAKEMEAEQVPKK